MKCVQAPGEGRGPAIHQTRATAHAALSVPQLRFLLAAARPGLHMGSDPL